MTILRALVFLLAATGAAHAQAPRPGQEVRVETAAAIVHGSLRSLGPDTLRLDARRKPVLIPLSEVLAIEVPVRESRARLVGRRTLLGLGVGTAAGFVASGFLKDQRGVRDLGGTLVIIGGETGAIAGALLGIAEHIPTRWQRAYP